MSRKRTKSERDQFLDNYFASKLQQLITMIKMSQANGRDDHVAEVFDSLMCISEEYQAVMLDKEDGYWSSVEMWNDECDQRKAVEMANQLVNRLA